MSKKSSAWMLLASTIGMGLTEQHLPKKQTDTVKEKKIQKCIDAIKAHEKYGDKAKVDYWTKRLELLL